MRISTVKLVISFCANAKFKDITCIVNHHYHSFHVPQRFYSVNKLLNHLSITHDPRLRTHCISSDLFTPPRRRLTGVKLGQVHCVYRHHLLTFSHNILEKYLGAMRRPCYNGVAVYIFDLTYQKILPLSHVQKTLIACKETRDKAHLCSFMASLSSFFNHIYLLLQLLCDNFQHIWTWQIFTMAFYRGQQLPGLSTEHKKNS